MATPEQQPVPLLQELIKPSEAYEQSTRSLVYRLSELMFGSLIASYVLGFVSFLAMHSRPLVNVPIYVPEWFTRLLSSAVGSTAMNEVLLAVPYVSISITYAYLTAGLYLSYHAGILTMLHLPFRRLRLDFSLALSQSVLFGVSILYPVVFPGSLGLILLGALARQAYEHRCLERSFRAAIPRRTNVRRPSGEQDAERKFIKEFKTALLQFPHLGGWKAPSTLVQLVAIAWVLLTAGVLILAATGSQLDAQKLMLTVSPLIATAVIWRTNPILGKTADLLYSQENRKTQMATMDDEFLELIKVLKCQQ